MRYESIPRKISNAIIAIYKTIRQEFGVWSYLMFAFILILLYKPFLKFMDLASTYILYIFLGGIGLLLIYLLFKKIFRRY